MAVQRVTWLLLLASLLLITDAESFSSATVTNDSSWYGAERRLRHAMMGRGDYDARERPVNVSSQPVQVQLSLAMYGLLSLDEREQILTGASWLILRWNDYRFRWDPADYGNLRYLSLHLDEVWTPAIVMPNTASERIENPIQADAFKALASWTGAMTLEGPIIHRTTCAMDLSQFPFDKQNCTIVFSAQNMPSCIVNLSLGTSVFVDTGIYSQWLAPSLGGEDGFEEIEDLQTGDVKIFSLITFYFSVERLPTHYMLNVALPSGILTFVSLGVFWLTPESGERISMGVSLVLGQAVFWLVVVEALPSTGSQGTPLLLDYIEVNFVVGGLAIVLSVITVSIYHQPGPLKSRLVRKLFLGRSLSTTVCMRCRARGNRVADVQSEKNHVATVTEVVKTGGPPEGEFRRPEAHQDGQLSNLSEKPVTDSDPVVDDAPNAQSDSEDMKSVAASLDLIFFVVMTITFTGNSIALFANYA